jgi:hypothetical protein
MLTTRQLVALYRVVSSMLNVEGAISVATDDLLTQKEMLDLQERLAAGK